MYVPLNISVNSACCPHYNGVRMNYWILKSTVHSIKN